MWFVFSFDLLWALCVEIQNVSDLETPFGIMGALRKTGEALAEKMCPTAEGWRQCI